MKTMHRYLSIILVLGMLMALCACGGAESTGESSADQSVQVSERVPEEASIEEVQSVELSEAEVSESLSEKFAYELPLVEEPATLEWLCALPNALTSYVEDQNDLLYMQILEEKTNVHIDFGIFSNDQAAAQFALMVAGGDYPDMVMSASRYYSGGVAQMLDEEFALDLSEFIDEEMPNYQYYLNEIDELRHYTYQNDGRVGMIYGFNNSPAYGTTMGLVMRQDYLDAVGMDVPVTYDDMEKTLLAMKDQLGLKAPMWISANGMITDSLSAGYGVKSFLGVEGKPPFYVEDGTIKFGPYEDAYGDYLTMLNKWYDEGLLYSDVGTVTGFMGINGYTDLIDQVACYMELGAEMPQRKASSTCADYALTAMVAPVQEVGQETHFANTTAQCTGEGVCITTQCDDVELAAHYIDYWYSDEGVIDTNWGREGETYVINDQGEPEYTEAVFDNELTTVVSIQMVAASNMSNVVDVRRNLVSYTDETLSAFSVWETQDDSYTIPSYMSLTTEQAEVINEYFSDIYTRCKEMSIKFIVGEASLDEFGAFQEELKALGVEECIAQYQAAYDELDFA